MSRQELESLQSQINNPRPASEAHVDKTVTESLSDKDIAQEPNSLGELNAMKSDSEYHTS